MIFFDLFLNVVEIIGKMSTLLIHIQCSDLVFPTFTIFPSNSPKYMVEIFY